MVMRFQRVDERTREKLASGLDPELGEHALTIASP